VCALSSNFFSSAEEGNYRTRGNEKRKLGKSVKADPDFSWAVGTWQLCQQEFIFTATFPGGGFTRNFARQCATRSNFVVTTEDEIFYEGMYSWIEQCSTIGLSSDDCPNEPGLYGEPGETTIVTYDMKAVRSLSGSELTFHSFGFSYSKKDGTKVALPVTLDKDVVKCQEGPKDDSIVCETFINEERNVSTVMYIGSELFVKDIYECAACHDD
jgi:hypothetical protein